ELAWQIQVSRCAGARWNALGAPSSDADSAASGVGLAVGREHPLVAWRPPSGADPPLVACRPSGPDPGAVDVASWTATGWGAYPQLVPPPGVAYSIDSPMVCVCPAHGAAVR